MAEIAFASKADPFFAGVSMRFALNFRNRLFAIIIASGMAVGGLSSYAVWTTLQRAIEDDARITAQNWAEYLVDVLPDIEAIVQGQRPSEESRIILLASENVGNVFRYKLFSPSGRLGAISGDREIDFHEIQTIGQHNARAEAVTSAGGILIDLERGDGVTLPEHFSEAYLPVVKDGKHIATLEVHIDETERYLSMTDAFKTLVAKLLGGLAVIFAIPAVAYHIRTRQRAQIMDELARVSSEDALTGAMNRVTFTRTLSKLIADATPFTVHVLDLDRFDSVNEAHGHTTGDALLREIARRLTTATNGRGFIGRLSGDEFAICQLGDSVEQANSLTRQIVGAISRPFRIDGKQITIGCSAGYASFPKNARSTAAVLQAADVALFHAKANGRGSGVGYHQSMERKREGRMRIEDSVRRALEESKFELQYQPFFSLTDNRLRGFEALLRLHDSEGNAIPPAVFVPIAEEIGLICRIGDRVLKESCRFAAPWPLDLTVAVNLSPAQFAKPGLASRVRETLEESRLPAHRLELEVTESVLITDAEAVIDQLQQLRALGVRIALDDFGTGYSSLGYLWRFPFDKLKIDRSFMDGIEDPSSKSTEILKSVVSLAKVLKLSVTAEGVETEAQLAALRSLDCPIAQGFLLGKPMTPIGMAAFIANAARHEKAPQPFRVIA